MGENRDFPTATVAGGVANGRVASVWLSVWLSAALAVIVVLAVVAHDRLSARAFDELGQRGENTLRLTVATLRGQLARFERLPAVLAEQPAVRALVRSPADPVLVRAANLRLREMARQLDASDIYVMAPDGTTLAASNFDQPHSFVGGNFAFRPYFSDALAGGEGRFYALGTTSLKRGYYFGAPIRVAGAILGVMVIKIDLDEIEQTWGQGDFAVMVTDPQGVVFLTSRPAWLFRALYPMTPDRMAVTRATRRYANAEVAPLPHTRTTGPAGHVVFEIPASDADSTETGAGGYLVVDAAMPDADWTVKVLMNTHAARRQALTGAAAATLLAGLALLSAMMIAQRRRQLAERLAIQQSARVELERRVAERTAQLAALNTTLESEVTERRATETRLRQTQTELVQAGKLAALGQMSAALSHEFNQPLAATRNYAENATLLLDRNRSVEARDNIDRILALVERMSRISRHLRNFARKPNRKLSHVFLPEVVAAAQEIMNWRLQAAGADLQIDIDPALPRVVAGPVRLQQVLVNILANALDAIDGCPDRRLHLSAQARRDAEGGDTVVLRLRDHGPGIADGVIDRIFDPFFSTKGVGKGLGLGLSISYNILRDFGGRLEARNHPGGGAEFSLTVRVAPADMPGPVAAPRSEAAE